MRIESLIHDARYAVRGVHRSPLFAASVAGTIGLGLGILCSAFTIVNAYLLKPIDLPNPRQLYALSWDTAHARRHGFRLSDFDALREADTVFSGVAAGGVAVVMEGDAPITGLLVSGDYFHVLGARIALGRPILPDDAAAPGARAVVVLAHDAWRSRYGADPAIVGKEITLGRHRFHVVGVLQPGSALPGDEAVRFWAPLTMAGAFGTTDPWRDTDVSSLFVIGRLRADATESQARAWFEAWLHRRFPPGSAAAPRAVRVESRATRIPLNRATTSMFSLIVAAFALVLLVACANVTNMMLARGIERQREMAVRLSLGASRTRLIRQLVVESLILAVPAAVVGLGLTLVTARAFPVLVIGTLPEGSPPATPFLAPLDPDVRVLGMLFVGAVISSVLVGLNPAFHVTRTSLAQVSRGAIGPDARISRLRTGLVAAQIAASVMFLVGASGLIDESRRMANPYTGLDYDRVLDVRVAEGLRANVVARLASDPAIEGVAAAWRPPLAGPLRRLSVVPASGGVEQAAGFAAVSPGYFDLFGIRVRGRVFTAAEADENAAVVVVSEATARRFWPGQDPIGQNLDILPSVNERERRPVHARVRVVGVADDVVSGLIIDGVDATCVYFPTPVSMAGETSILVRAGTIAAARQATSAAVRAVDPSATFRMYGIREMIGLQVWAFGAFSAAAGLLGVVGLLLAFSGTYAVVAFLVTQRTREFGIRMALGATVRRIVVGVLYGALRIAAAGATIGLIAAAALAHAFDAIIEMMPTFGAGPYVVGASIVVAATITAALVPSLRTSRIDPATALRAE